MREDRGITITTLVITIIVLLIIAGISAGTGNKVIKSSELENVKTNMLLIKAKGKEYVENANFKLGTNFKESTDIDNRIKTAKAELKKGEDEEMTNNEILEQNIGITQDNIKNNVQYL